MPGNVRVGGTWREVSGVSVRVAGIWRPVEKAWTRVGGVWREWFSSYNPALELITTVNVTTPVSTVTISSIPQNYRHLRVVVLGKSTSTSTGYDSMLWTINNIGLYYSGMSHRGASSSLGTDVTVTPVAFPRSASGYQNRFGLAIFDFPAYSGFANKTFQIFGGVGVDVSTAPTFLVNGYWNFNQAINRVDFTSQNGSFAAGSRFSVYGVKA